jgi:UDP-glucose 4-epimerase
MNNQIKSILILFLISCFVQMISLKGFQSRSSNNKKVILVTGGAGYIGSHTCLELLRTGEYKVVVIDNLMNSSEESLKRVSELTGQSIEFHKIDLLDYESLVKVLSRYQPSPGSDSVIFGVIHFAGLKAVGESWTKPLDYYDNNITGTLNLLRAMKECGNISRIIFSSSATVYGDTTEIPIPETCRLAPVSPYARTKAYIEQIIQDVVSQSPTRMQSAILRYFNPVGADASGRIGEDPRGIPNNLMPFVAQVAVGKLSLLRIFGKDYPSPDGTGVRDYIHVTDLALGHIAALKKLESATGNEARNLIVNLGTGKGTSVYEMRDTFSTVNNVSIPFEVVERRAGDVAFLVAQVKKAKEELNWEATLGLDRMCKDLWRWQKNNPKGYNTQ